MSLSVAACGQANPAPHRVPLAEELRTAEQPGPFEPRIVERVTSPAGGMVAIVQQDGPHPEGDLGDYSLWIEAGEARPRKCLLGRVCAPMNSQARNIGRPSFSPDGRHLYVATTTYVQSSSEILRLDPISGRITELGDGISVAVIRNGPYRGYLIVPRHTMSDDRSHFYYPSYLMDPVGRTVLRIPDEQE